MTDESETTPERAYAAAKAKVEAGLFGMGQAARALGDRYARRAAFIEAAEMAEAEADAYRKRLCSERDEAAADMADYLAAAYRAKAEE